MINKLLIKLLHFSFNKHIRIENVQLQESLIIYTQIAHIPWWAYLVYPLTPTPCTSFTAAHDARLTLTAPLHGSDNRQSLAAHLNHYLILILNALFFL